jgi:hypothetical protein
VAQVPNWCPIFAKSQGAKVGVLPKDFQFPTLQSADVIFPMALNRAAQATANGGFGTPMRAFARLKPGVSIAQAKEEMEPLFEHTLRYNTGQKEMDFYLRAEAAIRRLPGIRAVAISDSVPPGGWQGGSRSSDLVVEGKPKSEQGPGEPLTVGTVTPDYFQSLNIPIVRGHNFTEADRRSKESLIIISRLLAARLFSGEDPIGQRIHSSYCTAAAWYTVVGVAGNVKNGGLVGPDEPELYFLRRSAAENWGGRAPLLIVDSVLSTEATFRGCGRKLRSSIRPSR